MQLPIYEHEECKHLVGFRVLTCSVEIRVLYCCQCIGADEPRCAFGVGEWELWPSEFPVVGGAGRYKVLTECLLTYYP